jgi:hypothetical protein
MAIQGLPRRESDCDINHWPNDSGRVLSQFVSTVQGAFPSPRVTKKLGRRWRRFQQVCKMRSLFFLAVALLLTPAFSFPMAQAAGLQCGVFGTAPACAGGCPDRWQELQRVDDGCSVSGLKSYCCGGWPDLDDKHPFPPDQQLSTLACHTFGAGPFCAGHCPAGWTETGRSTDGCVSGSKAQCCDRRGYCPIDPKANRGWALCKQQQATMQWPIKNNYKLNVEVRFFAMSRKKTWPDPGSVYPFKPGESATVTIDACLEGEQVCFGASAPEAPGTYWGVGPDNKQGCQGCCHSCKDGKVKGHDLNAQMASLRPDGDEIADDQRDFSPKSSASLSDSRMADVGRDNIQSLEGEWALKETGEILRIGKGGTWFHPVHGAARIRKADDGADIKVFYESGSTRCSYRLAFSDQGKSLDLVAADTMQDPDYCPQGGLKKVGG